MPEFWVRLLLTYGPAGLLVFLMYVIERRIRVQMRPTVSHLLFATTYIIFWVTVFVLCGVLTYAWIRLNLHEEATIRGRLTGLAANEELRSPFEDMYLRRVYGVPSRPDFAWRIITQKELPPGTRVTLYLDRSTSEHEDFSVYEMPIKPDFYDTDREVLLAYDRSTRKLSVKSDSSSIPLEERTSEASSKTPVKTGRVPLYAAWVGLASAYGQKHAQLETMDARLESDDAIIRSEARTELAAMGQAGLPYIERVLSQPNSSYRLRLGVISALTKMANVPDGALSAAANCSILRAAYAYDSTLRSYASQYINAHRLSVPESCGSITCQGSLKELRLQVGHIAKVGQANLYVYLAGISSSDEAEVYLIDGAIEAVPRSGELSRNRLMRELRAHGFKLQPRERMQDGSYQVYKLGRAQGAKVLVSPDLGLGLTVVETHYFKNYAIFQICEQRTKVRRD